MIDFSFASSLDCYFVLGVRPDATPADVEAAYANAMAALPARGLVGRFKCFWFGRNLRNVRDAYRTLADPAAREQYDAWRRRRAFSFCPPF